MVCRQREYEKEKKEERQKMSHGSFLTHEYSDTGSQEFFPYGLYVSVAQAINTSCNGWTLAGSTPLPGLVSEH